MRTNLIRSIILVFAVFGSAVEAQDEYVPAPTSEAGSEFESLKAAALDYEASTAVRLAATEQLFAAATGPERPDALAVVGELLTNSETPEVAVAAARLLSTTESVDAAEQFSFVAELVDILQLEDASPSVVRQVIKDLPLVVEKTIARQDGHDSVETLCSVLGSALREPKWSEVCVFQLVKITPAIIEKGVAGNGGVSAMLPLVDGLADLAVRNAVSDSLRVLVLKATPMIVEKALAAESGSNLVGGLISSHGILLAECSNIPTIRLTAAEQLVQLLEKADDSTSQKKQESQRLFVAFDSDYAINETEIVVSARQQLWTTISGVCADDQLRLKLIELLPRIRVARQRVSN